MPLTKLAARSLGKVWGRRDIPRGFGGARRGREPIGEIWFDHPAGRDVDLLVKFLFTSEKLSIQVHPDAQAAAKAGLPRGKEEAWIVLGAEPDAAIAVGLNAPVAKDRLRAAALDGSIEALIDWRPARAGQVYYAPGGTIHTLGAGLTLIEVQQNADVTYRLYDYGSPRALQLDEAVEAADPALRAYPPEPRFIAPGREVLADGRAFVLERLSGAFEGRLDADSDFPVWLVPMSGGAALDGEPLKRGGVWIADGPGALKLGRKAVLLLAYSGRDARADLLG